MVVPPSKLTFQWKNGPFEDIFSTKRKGTFHCLFLFADFDTFSQGSFFFFNDFPFPKGWRCDRSQEGKILRLISGPWDGKKNP